MFHTKTKSYKLLQIIVNGNQPDMYVFIKNYVLSILIFFFLHTSDEAISASVCEIILVRETAPRLGIPWVKNTQSVRPYVVISLFFSFFWKIRISAHIRFVFVYDRILNLSELFSCILSTHVCNREISRSRPRDSAKSQWTLASLNTVLKDFTGLIVSERILITISLKVPT